jgi:hypothetical protein
VHPWCNFFFQMLMILISLFLQFLPPM